jgi:hypothetical protein
MEILLALAAAVSYGVSDFAGGVLTRRAHVFVVFLLPGADTLSEHTFGVKYLSRPNRTQVRVGIPSSRWAHCGRGEHGRGAPGHRHGDGRGGPRPATLVTLRTGAATLRHFLADCWQTTLRRGAGDALCLVELRGFEPLTPCMPYTVCPGERRCSEPSPLVKARAQLPAGHRCCPLLSPASCPRHAPRAPLRVQPGETGRPPTEAVPPQCRSTSA